MNTFLRRTAGALSFALLLSVAPAHATEPGGRYVLQGVMETGSELHLRDDGRFEWSLAYGALDHIERGRWTREDGGVLLLSERPGRGEPLFRLDQVFAWDVDAEARLRRSEQGIAFERAHVRCPFLSVADHASAPAIADAEPPSQAALDQAARDSLPLLDGTRKVAESAAESAVKTAAHAELLGSDAGARRDAEQAMQLAIAAMEAYRANLAHAREAHGAAGLAMPALPAPRVAAECGLPADGAATATPVASGPDGGRGIGVVVGDPAVGVRYPGLRVDFEFSDGHREQRVTDRAGWALLRPRAGATLRRLWLRSGDDAPSPDAEVAQTFDVDPARGDVHAIVFDSARMMTPMFERMTLRIDGEALVPTWPDGEERGRYVRE